VDGLCPGVEHDLPTGAPASPAPVNILTVHEELLIEQSKLGDSRAAGHDKAADQDVYLTRPIISKVGHVLTGKKTGLRE
jgi:hypothetical protein